jgi:hypothetical protein
MGANPIQGPSPTGCQSCCRQGTARLWYLGPMLLTPPPAGPRPAARRRLRMLARLLPLWLAVACLPAPPGGTPPAEASLPTIYALERLDAGRLLAVDRGGNRLLVLDHRGRVMTSLGGSGQSLGAWAAPGETDGRLGLQVLAADRDNRRLCQLDARLAVRGAETLPGDLSEDFAAPDLLALSAGRTLVIADARLGGVLARPPFGDWRVLADFALLGRRLRPAGLEVLGETVFVLDRPLRGDPRLLSMDTAGGAVRQRDWPGLLALHRADDRDLLLLVREGSALLLRRWTPASGEEPRPGAGAVLARWQPGPDLPGLRDFLLLDGGLLLAPVAEPPRWLHLPDDSR